jgi:hypothetical protein
VLSALSILFLVIVLFIIVLISWLIAHIFGKSTHTTPPSLLPKVGMNLSGAFLHRGEQIHVYCRIEDSEESRLLVRIMSELGKSSLLGMRPGTSGELEMGNYWLPIEVVNVSLPWVTVETFANRAKPVRRGSLRVPAPFVVRFRAQGLTRHWTPATGINVSSGGFCFSSSYASELRVGRLYEIEITPADANRSGETFLFLAELRWLFRTMEGTVAGLQLFDQSKQRDLARLVNYMEHRVARHPEDYLLESNPKPDISRLH